MQGSDIEKKKHFVEILRSLVTFLFKMTLCLCLYFAYTKNPIILSLLKLIYYTSPCIRSKLNRNSSKINVNGIVLVYNVKVPKHFCRIAIIARVSPSRDSEIREAIVKSAKTNTILKRPINKLFAIENTYHDTNQTDKAREQKLR